MSVKQEVESDFITVLIRGFSAQGAQFTVVYLKPFVDTIFMK